MDMVEDLLALHDPKLLAHFKRCNITAQACLSLYAVLIYVDLRVGHDAVAVF
jgi:hypothetical protein